MASIRPKTPAEIRSSRSTPSGRRCQIRSALYLTRGKYRSTRRLRRGVVGCSLNSRQSSVTSTSSFVDILDLHVGCAKGGTSMCTGPIHVPAAVRGDDRPRPRASRPCVPPLTPHDPRNPILLIYRTTGGTVLNGTTKSVLTIDRLAAAASC